MAPLRQEVLTLVVCWSQSGEHLGEVLRVFAGPRSGWTFGSDADSAESGTLQLVRQRPGSTEARAFESAFMARVELGLSAQPNGIDVRRLGKCRLVAHDGRRVEQVLVRPGETLEIEDQLLFMCSSRPAELSGPVPDPALHPFGLA